MEKIKFKIADGGRKTARYIGEVGDCAVRAICNAGDYDYQSVYDLVNKIAKTERNSKLKEGNWRSSARNGVHMPTMRKIMEVLVWSWTPTMGIGTGCRIHVKSSELPAGRLVLSLSRHFTAMVDGVVIDNQDCSRSGTRCVYGYWTKP